MTSYPPGTGIREVRKTTEEVEGRVEKTATDVAGLRGFRACLRWSMSAVMDRQAVTSRGTEFVTGIYSEHE